MADRNEFEAVMRANGPKIYTLAIRLTGNEAAGADLAQDTFVKAWESWSRFRNESEAGTWLYRICVNAWKNRVRYEKRRSFWKHFSLNGFQEDDEPGLRDLPDRSPPLEAPMERAQDQERVQSALARLPAEDRALLVLREIDEKSYDEIAALMDWPLGTVKSRLARAREKLAQEFSRVTS